MPVAYDIRTDFLYKKGKEEGKEEGLRIVVTRALEKGMSPEEIAELADMPVEWVKAVILEIEAEKKEEG